MKISHFTAKNRGFCFVVVIDRKSSLKSVDNLKRISVLCTSKILKNR